MCAVRIITTDQPPSADGEFDLSQYPTEFLMCRSSMRHTLPPLNHWRWSVVRAMTGRVIEATATAQCITCKAIVQDVVNGQNGQKKRRITRPTLPVVYRIPKSAGVTPYDLRLELLSRVSADNSFHVEADTTESNGNES